MSPDYFSIDDILAEEPRVYATFLVEGHLLGHLDPLGSLGDDSNKENSPVHANSGAEAPAPSRRAHNLRAGRRVALPFWLVETLASRGAVEAPTRESHACGAPAQNPQLV